jgi:hypothetical protein
MSPDLVLRIERQRPNFAGRSCSGSGVQDPRSAVCRDAEYWLIIFSVHHSGVTSC